MYRRIHAAMSDRLIASCHDLSDGGLAVALCESALGGRLGASADLHGIAGVDSDEAVLFCETPSRFLLTCSSGDAARLEVGLSDLPLTRLGEVIGGQTLEVRRDGRSVLAVSMEEIYAAWHTPI